MNEHRFPLRVYYEDTDLAGIVYYANYLKFIERGRSEYVRALGIDQVELKEGRGLVFAVRRVEADYLSPARFDDRLEVLTAIGQIGGARLVMAQRVMRGEEILFTAQVTLVLMSLEGRPARIPADIRARLEEAGGGQASR